VYNDETQVATQDQLSLLQKKCDDLKERVSLLQLDQLQTNINDSIAHQMEKSDKLSQEIGVCIHKYEEYTARIIEVKNILKMGSAAQKQVQNQDKRRALRQIQGSVFRVSSNIQPVGERSLAWMMATHARLGDKIDCVARVLDGQDLVFDIIRQLSLTKDAADIHKDNSARLVIKTKALLNKPMYAILAKIDNAVDKQKMDSTAEEGVVANLDVFCVHDVSSLTEDEQVTLRHMLFSTEFIDRQFDNRYIYRYPGGVSVYRDNQDGRRRMTKYVSNMIERLEYFSAGLFTLTMSSGSSYKLCLIVKQSRLSETDFDHYTTRGDCIIPIITEQVASAKACVVLRSPMHFFCQISLYNLDDQDLVLSGNPIRESAQLHRDDFRIRQSEDDEIPMHNSNVVPAHGFGNLHEIACPKGRQRREYHLKDVNNKVVLTFVMQYNNQVTA